MASKVLFKICNSKKYLLIIQVFVLRKEFDQKAVAMSFMKWTQAIAGAQLLPKSISYPNNYCQNCFILYVAQYCRSLIALHKEHCKAVILKFSRGGNNKKTPWLFDCRIHRNPHFLFRYYVCILCFMRNALMRDEKNSNPRSCGGGFLSEDNQWTKR